MTHTTEDPKTARGDELVPDATAAARIHPELPEAEVKSTENPPTAAGTDLVPDSVDAPLEQTVGLTAVGAHALVEEEVG